MLLVQEFLWHRLVGAAIFLYPVGRQLFNLLQFCWFVSHKCVTLELTPI